MLTVQDIKNIKFKRSKLGGYSTDNVDDFIDDVEASFEELVNKCNRQNEKIAELTSRVADYTEKQDSIRDLIEGAQRFSSSAIKESKAKAENLVKEAEDKSNEMVKEAENKSSEMLKEAESKSSEMVKEAESKSNEMLKNAENKSNEILKEAEMRARNMLEEAQSKASKINKESDKKIKAKIELLDDLNKKVTTFRSELLDAYKSHLKLVDIFPRVALESEKERFRDLNKPSFEMEEDNTKVESKLNFSDISENINIQEPENNDINLETKEDYSSTSDFTFEMSNQEDIRPKDNDIDYDKLIEDSKINDNQIESFVIPGIDFESAFKALSDEKGDHGIDSEDIDDLEEDTISKYAKGMSPLDLFNLK